VGLTGSMIGDGMASISTTPSRWITFTLLVVVSCAVLTELCVFIVTQLGSPSFGGAILLNYERGCSES
jgi:hypothetical protein